MCKSQIKLSFRPQKIILNFSFLRKKIRNNGEITKAHLSSCDLISAFNEPFPATDVIAFLKAATIETAYLSEILHQTLQYFQHCF